MSLLDVQRSLVGFARGSTNEYQSCTNLTSGEDEWLKELWTSRGLMVTQQIQQWWRLSRICLAAPLSIELLKRAGLEELIIEYITTEPVRSLFFAAELEQFKCFLQAHLLVNSLTKTMIEFESGIKTATQRAATSQTAHCHSYALSLTFDRCPHALFSALLTGAPLPPADPNGYVLEISSMLESLWVCYRTGNTISHKSMNLKNHISHSR
jgi:hypothetical protein